MWRGSCSASFRYAPDTGRLFQIVTGCVQFRNCKMLLRIFFDVFGTSSAIPKLTSALREFIAPRYRPELHYMRGPGPASARRLSKPLKIVR